MTSSRKKTFHEKIEEKEQKSEGFHWKKCSLGFTLEKKKVFLNFLSKSITQNHFGHFSIKIMPTDMLLYRKIVTYIIQKLPEECAILWNWHLVAQFLIPKEALQQATGISYHSF